MAKSEMQYAMVDAQSAANETRIPHGIAYVEDDETGAMHWAVFPMPVDQPMNGNDVQFQALPR